MLLGDPWLGGQTLLCESSWSSACMDCVRCRMDEVFGCPLEGERIGFSCSVRCPLLHVFPTRGHWQTGNCLGQPGEIDGSDQTKTVRWWCPDVLWEIRHWFSLTNYGNTIVLKYVSCESILLMLISFWIWVSVSWWDWRPSDCGSAFLCCWCHWTALP